MARQSRLSTEKGLRLARCYFTTTTMEHSPMQPKELVSATNDGLLAWPLAITTTTAGRTFTFLISARTACITTITTAHSPMLPKGLGLLSAVGQPAPPGEITTTTD